MAGPLSLLDAAMAAGLSSQTPWKGNILHQQVQPVLPLRPSSRDGSEGKRIISVGKAALLR